MDQINQQTTSPSRSVAAVADDVDALIADCDRVYLDADIEDAGRDPAAVDALPVEHRVADVEHEVFDYGEKSLGFAIDQDMGMTAGQQLGFRSRGFKGVYLSGQERRIRRYHEVIDDYIEGRRPLKKKAD